MSDKPDMKKEVELGHDALGRLGNFLDGVVALYKETYEEFPGTGAWDNVGPVLDDTRVVMQWALHGLNVEGTSQESEGDGEDV